MNQYGINVDKLGEFVIQSRGEKTEWGSRTLIISRQEFSLEKIEINSRKSYLLETDKTWEATVFLEEGLVTAGDTSLDRGEVISFGANAREKLLAQEDSSLYIFRGRSDASAGDYGVKSKTSDYREKYWGSIETIVNKSYTGKRIFCRAREHSSLEFHCRKVESYFVHSGKLLVRLRAGRAEDRFFELPAGSGIFIPPGLMHERGGKEDTVIIEISTHDEDADSFLVEDGQKTKMPNLLS